MTKSGGGGICVDSCGQIIGPAKLGYVLGRHLAIRAPLQMDPVARPCIEDVTSQAKILGCKHERPPNKPMQAKGLTVQPRRYVKL
eukprot:12800822-Ditylum_brightwellii.AAC.1